MDHHAPAGAGRRVDPVDLEYHWPGQGAGQFGALIGANEYFLVGYGKIDGVNLGSPIDDDAQAAHGFLAYEVHALTSIQLGEA